MLLTAVVSSECRPIDCHVVSCGYSVEGVIGHITPNPVSHFAAEFREIDSWPIPRV